MFNTELDLRTSYHNKKEWEEELETESRVFALKKLAFWCGYYLEYDKMFKHYFILHKVNGELCYYNGFEEKDKLEMEEWLIANRRFKND